MIRLTPAQYVGVRPLYAPLRYQLVIDSVVDGNTPAWVYADDATAPSVALMWDRQDALLLAGDADRTAWHADLAAIIGQEIVPDARRRGVPALSLADTPAWEQHIPALLRPWHPAQVERRYYTFAGPRIDPWASAQAGDIRRIDAGLLARQDLAHLDQVRGWIASFWHAEGDFLGTGFGYCLLQEDAAASWCLTVFASGREVELGLATVPTYRNRGFATLAAAACVDHCLQHGLVPHWHCREDNRASRAVAEKVGFGRPQSYEVYELRL